MPITRSGCDDKVDHLHFTTLRDHVGYETCLAEVGVGTRGPDCFSSALPPGVH